MGSADHWPSLAGKAWANKISIERTDDDVIDQEGVSVATNSITALVAEIRDAGRLDQAGFVERVAVLEAEHGMAAMSAAYEALHKIGAREAAARPPVFESDDNGMRGATEPDDEEA